MEINTLYSLGSIKENQTDKHDVSWLKKKKK